MQYFTPSDDTPPLRILPDAFPRLPLAVARAAIETYSQPGDVILDPFCIGASVIRAGIEAGRRIIAASFNPIHILAIEATLWPADPRAAFTHLSDARKGPARLRDHVLALYATRCPTCGRESIALSYTWDRDQSAPIEKHVQCESCGENIGPVDEADRSSARRFEPRGLPFWTLHGRVIDPKGEEADRVGEVLGAYTPRNQSAIHDILLKFDGLVEDDRSVLRPALLAMLDACTALHAPDESRRLTGLKVPARFVEKNVWLELERQIETRPAAAYPVPPAARVSSIQSLLAATQPAICLLAAPARELAKQLPARSIRLMLAYPPPPRPGFWSLSTVWTAWLWGTRAAASDALLPLLSRRRTNWDWQWRAIASALNALNPALSEDMHSVMAFANDESMLESVALAAAAANHTLEHLVCDPHDGIRVTWRPGAARTGDRDLEALSIDVRDLTLKASVKILRDRAEPTGWPTLQAGIFAALGQSNVLAIAARLPEGDQLPLAFVRDTIKAALAAADSPLITLEENGWWLKDAARVNGPPLADRVELAVVELLRARDEWRSNELLREVYRRFPGNLTPDRSLLASCLGSYSEESEPGQVRLRPEDSASARGQELREAQENLQAIGSQLGFEVRREGQQVVWKQLGNTVYSFVISSSAEIGVLLPSESPSKRASGAAQNVGVPVLVIPGGRATLLQHKIARDARLRESPPQGAWQTLKFSSLRHIAHHADLSLNTFTLAFGLEPPIEQGQVQMGLWGSGMG